MSNSKNSEFSGEDRRIAQRAWDVYMSEIDGGGLRYRLDVRPRGLEEFLARGGLFSPAGHLNEIGRFEDRIRRFGGFVTDLKRFRGRPITSERSLARDEAPTITREIDEAALVTYGTLHTRAQGYAKALRRHGPGSPQVREATIAAASIVNPKEWKKEGIAIPEGVVPYYTLGTRWYLEAVIDAK